MCSHFYNRWSEIKVFKGMPNFWDGTDRPGKSRDLISGTGRDPVPEIRSLDFPGRFRPVPEIRHARSLITCSENPNATTTTTTTSRYLEREMSST